MTSSKLAPIVRPSPLANVTLHQIFSGPPVAPLERVRSYDEDSFEDFIAEWAYFYLQEIEGKYETVARFGGAGDKGRDVVAYITRRPATCDYFQCKHYVSPLTPSNVWEELAKLCMHTHDKTIPIPHAYRFVCPSDIGPSLGRLLEAPAQMKSELKKVWLDESGKGPLCNRLISGKKVRLVGTLLKHVNSFDFSIVHFKPIQEVIAEHGRTIRHPARFGGGLVKAFPEDLTPPRTLDPRELPYVNALLTAYRDHLNNGSLKLSELKYHRTIQSHYIRSRERFYCAETVREFAKDTLPENFKYKDVQDQIYDAVIDIADGTWPCGLTRVNEVVKAAQNVSITNHPLGSYLKVKSRQGICHQLAGEKRLVWVPDEQQ
ncbi:MAG: hypothetical protein JWN70_572 [Planctomycetaceae bacterium]|nr:hypothetical protein [Planctomycetaceae bacterium]